MAYKILELLVSRTRMANGLDLLRFDEVYPRFWTPAIMRCIEKLLRGCEFQWRGVVIGIYGNAGIMFVKRGCCYVLSFVGFPSSSSSLIILLRPTYAWSLPCHQLCWVGAWCWPAAGQWPNQNASRCPAAPRILYQPHYLAWSLSSLCTIMVQRLRRLDDNLLCLFDLLSPEVVVKLS